MARINLSFSAQVDAWVKEVKTRELAVFRGSAQRVIAEMQTPAGDGGRMPVDTGFLRASLQMTLNAPATGPLQKPLKGSGRLGTGQFDFRFDHAELGDMIYATYGAAYARRLEYGFVGQDSLGRTYNQVGKAFVRSAAQKWGQIVAQVSTELKARVNGQS
ncbi:HK97 gp10 family phage protein [Xanthobacter autotrophicus]|uniref:HK97 gp10 family phage protein n=1 Tax=Xanthobacter autotrophicus TaxID=280 RepID=UPI003728233B